MMLYPNNLYVMLTRIRYEYLMDSHFQYPRQPLLQLSDVRHVYQVIAIAIALRCQACVPGDSHCYSCQMSGMCTRWQPLLQLSDVRHVYQVIAIVIALRCQACVPGGSHCYSCQMSGMCTRCVVQDNHILFCTFLIY